MQDKKDSKKSGATVPYMHKYKFIFLAHDLLV